MRALAKRDEAPDRPHAYLVRGWRDLWSEGIDTLGQELQAEGIDAHVYAQRQSAELGDALVARYRALPPTAPLVLIGYSFGADEAIRIATRLGKAGVPVDLLVTLDPVTPPPIPSNVRVCRNFYQSNGVWDALPWLRGVPVKRGGEAHADVSNVNVREHPELADGSTSHATMTGNGKLHEAILAEVRRVCRTSANPAISATQALARTPGSGSG